MNSSNPAQSVKAVEWEGKASITFDWKRGGLVIELEGRGKVTTEFDQVQVAIPDDPLWTDKDEQRIKDYKVTPEEQAAFDSGKPFSIDTATGIATISGHVSGDTYNWAGEFDVPVTFSGSKK